MKLLLVLALVGLVNSRVTMKKSVAPIELDYHNAIGIPAAARIKAAEEAPSARIYHGAKAYLEDFSPLGGLIISLNTGDISYCGSTLISHTRAVTAAHCVRTKTAHATKLTVVFGSERLFSGGTRRTTSHIEIHPRYDMDTLKNDVALIGFQSVNYSYYIYNADLACGYEYESGENLFVGAIGWISGFGKISDASEINSNQDRQRKGKVHVITDLECQAVYGDIIGNDKICATTATGYATCYGDSGGPLFAGGRLIGIHTFGHNSSCEQGYPDVFSRVTFYAPWILHRLGQKQ